MQYIGGQHNSSTNFGQRASWVVQHVGIGSADMQVATILVVGDGAILHQVEGPHWFVNGI